jgi:phosphate transport system protein
MGEETPAGPGERRSRFHQELSGLKDQLVTMARLAQTALEQSVAALFHQDGERARRVIEGDAALNRLELALDGECARVVALYQPVAIDLRLVMAVDHINHELERIGDQSVNIAEEVLELLRLPLFAWDTELPLMVERVTEMVRLSLEAFLRQDGPLAHQVCAADDEVDSLDRTIIKSLLDYMVLHPETVPAGQSLINIVRNLERVGDHATNIGEHVIYLVEGEMIRTP